MDGIPADLICNGEEDCPEGEDELDCSEAEMVNETPELEEKEKDENDKDVENQDENQGMEYKAAKMMLGLVVLINLLLC